MSIRDTLEAIWNDGKVRCPKHIIWWSRTSDTEDRKCNEEADGLFYAKGRRVELRESKNE